MTTSTATTLVTSGSPRVSIARTRNWCWSAPASPTGLDFYRSIARQIQELQERPARNFQSAEQSGREAWLEKYPDYFRPERSISYYNKGELLGFLLDLGIRHATANGRSLDDVMRRLNQDFAHRGRFFTDDDLKNIHSRARARIFRR